VYLRFYKALEKIGLEREERLRRRVSFHSYRHWFNTCLLESGLSPETIRLLTGHTPQMTARYNHAQLVNIKYLPALDFSSSSLSVGTHAGL
jgi:integrase